MELEKSRIGELWASEAIKWAGGLERLTDGERAWLTGVGLPGSQDWTLRFEGDLVGQVVIQDGHEYLVIGLDAMVPLGLDLGSGRAVWCLEPYVGVSSTTRFVNSSLGQFISSLAIYWRYRQAVRAMDDEDQIQDLIKEVVAELGTCDSRSTSGAENYWSLITVQMRDGLL